MALGRATEPELIVPGASSKWPIAWSPDSRFLAFSRSDADRAGGSGRRLRAPAASPRFTARRHLRCAGLEFSPDGTRVAYMSHESGQADVYVDSYPMPDNRIRVSTEGGGWPKWRRDGRELYYLAPDRKLMVSSVQTTACRNHVLDATKRSSRARGQTRTRPAPSSSPPPTVRGFSSMRASMTPPRAADRDHELAGASQVAEPRRADSSPPHDNPASPPSRSA